MLFMAAMFSVGVSVLLEHDGSVLLLHRAVSKDHGSGEWEPVSGRVESGETAEQAAVREVDEETGLRAYDLQPFDTFSFRRTTGEELIGITFRAKVDVRDVSISAEHDQYKWVPRSQLLATPAPSAVAECFRKYLVSLP